MSGVDQNQFNTCLFDLAVWVLHTSATGNKPAFHKLELEER